MPIQLPRPVWAMVRPLAGRYDVAHRRLTKDFGLTREAAGAVLVEWDDEAAKRGIDRLNPDYFREVWAWHAERSR